MSKVFKPLYLQFPTEVLHDPNVCDGDVLVYAVILWYHGLKDGVCKASNQALSVQSRKSNRTIEAVLTRLEKAGHIKRYYDESGKRLEIKPLTSLGYVKTRKGIRAEADNPTLPSVQRDNKIKNKIHISKDDLSRVYATYSKLKDCRLSSSDFMRISKSVRTIIDERKDASIPIIIKGFEWLARQSYSWTSETLNKVWHNYIKDANIMPSDKEVWTDEQWARYISSAPTTGIRCSRQAEYAEHRG